MFDKWRWKRISSGLTVHGIQINMDLREVQFQLGEGSVMSNEKSYFYEENDVIVDFDESSKVESITILCLSKADYYFQDLDFSLGDSQDLLVSKLGEPSSVSYSPDNQEKLLGYKKLSLTFELKKGKVCGFTARKNGLTDTYK